MEPGSKAVAAPPIDPTDKSEVAVRTRVSPRLCGILAVLLVAIFAMMPGTTSAVDQSIVAIVNDDVISKRDLDNRMALYFVTSNVPDTPQTRRQLTRDMVNSLIDDTLKRQEAKRLGILVSRPELERAMNGIARQLNSTTDTLPQTLSARGTNISALLEQVESEIGWLKSVRRLAGPQLGVTDEEVDEELARINANAGSPEYRVAEIFLPIPQASDEQQVEQLADELIRQIRAGARFSAAARSFSQSASAALGGDLGYVRRGQLAPQLDAVLETLPPGQLSTPIRTPGGIYLLFMIDRRIAQGVNTGVVTVSLYQLFLPLPANAAPASVNTQRQRAASLSFGAASCAELEERASTLDSQLSGSLGTVQLSQLPPELRNVVSPLQTGEISQPVRTERGIVVLMVCDRQEQDASQQVRNTIREQIREQKATAASRRFMRDLRRSSLIDVRI
jgi:peptidyl-prolyl cis-trans isomerase SurA